MTMETDRHYFIEGLFIIGISIAAAFFFVWLQTSGHRDDLLYRIHFNESVSGLTLGDPVKFHGVDVGTVKAMALDVADPRKVQVDVKLRKEAPVKTDTKASLKLKGITGVVFIELNGGAPSAQRLAAVTPEGQIPEIASEKSSLTAVFDQLPKVLEKFSAIEDQTKKVVTDVGEVTGKIKENPLLRLGAPKEKPASASAESTAPPPKEKVDKAPRSR
jgi:phospholipid/cholesterol/gamma-HCH transport system substrate-binding protein